ncbi:MAG: hypothetical protein ABSG68_10250 [Thermoguttaceae bacterium]|jgi:hypothetical protein
MHKSKPVSPEHKEFLAAILEEQNDPAETATFVAAILGEEHPGQAAGERERCRADHSHEGWFGAILNGFSEVADPFAPVTLRDGYNPDEPRDWRGRWTAGGAGGGSNLPNRRSTSGAAAGELMAQLPGESADEVRQRIDRELAPKGPTPTDERTSRADANSVMFRMRKFASKDGTKTFDARFTGFDKHGNVLLKKASGETIAVSPEQFNGEDSKFSEKDTKFLQHLEDLQKDKGFMAGLKAKPDNVHVDSTGIKGDENRQQWEEQVIRNIGMLSELPSGQDLLDDAKHLGKPITIKPNLTGSDNSSHGSTVFYNPERAIGAKSDLGKERPPFIGLGQELFNAMASYSRGTAFQTKTQRENSGLSASEPLRRDYNETIKDQDRLNELTRRYPDRGAYPGWGRKAVGGRTKKLPPGQLDGLYP